MSKRAGPNNSPLNVYLKDNNAAAPERVTDELGWSSDQLVSAAMRCPPVGSGIYTLESRQEAFFNDDTKVKEIQFVISWADMFTTFYTQDGTDQAQIDPKQLSDADKRIMKEECSRFFWPATMIRIPAFQRIFWRQLPPRHVLSHPQVSSVLDISHYISYIVYRVPY